jgi:hypothetical protein
MGKPKVLPQRHLKQTPQSGVHCLLPVKFVEVECGTLY